MHWKNTTENWGLVSKTFHWIIAIIVLCMLVIGFIMGGLPKSVRPDVYQIHKSFGITLLVLMLFRLWWRLRNPVPELPLSTPKWQKTLAYISHGLLYSLLILMPLVGWIMSTAAGHPVNYFFMATIPMPFIHVDKPMAHFFGELHEEFAWALVVLIPLHILGALKHHFVNKDNVLKRMFTRV